MKAIIFLCFALIASCHQSAVMSRADILSLLQQDYTVDNVLDLFNQLRANQQAGLADLDSNYAQADAVNTGEIQRTTGILQDQVDQCQREQDEIDNEQKQQDNLAHNIQESQDTITSNNDKAKQAADLRCASSLNAIAQLAKKQEQVEFLQYLRSRVADPAFVDYVSQQSGAFLQIKAALASKAEGEILSLIAKHHMLSMIQKSSKKQAADYQGETAEELANELNANVRTDEEIGTDYQDNSRGALQVQDVDQSSQSVEQLVQELLNEIDALIASHQAEIATVQDGETKAVQAFIDYKRQLEDQNYVLQKYIDAATQDYNRNADLITHNQDVIAECRAQITVFQQQVQSAQDAKAAADQQYATRRANLVDTLALLDQVIQVYTDEVVNQASDNEKYRADDYLDNQAFDQSFGQAS